MSSNDKLDKIEYKIDKLEDRLASIDTTLAAQHESLKIHIKRTDLLEQKLEPIERDRISLRTIIKVILFLSVILTIIESAIRIKNG